MKTDKRTSGLDLIRCLAMLLVVTYHFFLRNGYDRLPQEGFAMWTAGWVRTLSICCIGLFLMLTGYLKSEKTSFRSCYRCLVPVLIAYLLASAVSIPIRHFFFDSPRSFIDWSKTLVQFTAVYYGWYVEMYLGLILLSPFVNILLKNLTDKSLIVLTAVLILLTGLPGSIPWNIFPDFWVFLFPFTYYVLGAAVRRLQPKLPAWAGIVCAGGIAAVLAAVTMISTNDILYTGVCWEFQDLWVMIMAFCLFISLYQIKFSAAFSTVLAFGAAGCYGACLLSHLFDAWVYTKLPQWHTPAYYLPLFLCATIPIYFLSITLGNLLQRMTNLISSFILNKCKQKTS